QKVKIKKHTTVGIRWWSPTQLLVYRSEAYVWQSGRDAQFSSVCGRMYLNDYQFNCYSQLNWKYLKARGKRQSMRRIIANVVMWVLICGHVPLPAPRNGCCPLSQLYLLQRETD
ncbi:hypothetical protein B0O99DRAFT_718684, partial [Bisporella sp. PMI_857]